MGFLGPLATLRVCDRMIGPSEQTVKMADSPSARLVREGAMPSFGILKVLVYRETEPQCSVSSRSRANGPLVAKSLGFRQEVR